MPELQSARTIEGTLVLGLPHPAYIIFGVEFTERLAYYAVAFSLFTYGRHMLSISASGMQAIMNAIYVVVPAAACVSSGLADGRWGRSRTLMTFLVAYAAGLGFLTVSSLPFMFHSFPERPLIWSYLSFVVALCLFAVGYGGMKVCTNPMMADSVAATYKSLFAAQNEETARMLSCREDSSPAAADGMRNKMPSEHGSGVPHKAEKATSDCGSATVLDDTNRALSSSVSVSVLENQKDALERALARAFSFVYWVSNFGSLFGIFAAPLMRGWESRRITFGSDEYTTGYYFGFALATISVIVGLAFFFQFRVHFPPNEPAPPFLFFRLVARAAKVRLLFAVGKIKDSDFQASVSKHDYLSYGTYNGTGTVTQNEESFGPLTDVVIQDTDSTPQDVSERVDTESARGSIDCRESWLADCRATLRVCKAFVALPIYWLISNQYSTTLMFSLEALSLPTPIPPELFNNINTFTLLVSIALCDRVIYPYWHAKHNGRAPSPRSRIVCGFLLVTVSMVWCGVVQVGIARRGRYVGADGRYEVYPGQSQLSAGWMVMPYVLQGVAAALVDPASMEVAYTGAPEHMKGTVMALYWVASSASGFLGLILSPVMSPQNGVGLYFGFAVVLVLVTVLFYQLNYSGAYANATVDAVEAQLKSGSGMKTSAASAEHHDEGLNATPHSRQRLPTSPLQQPREAGGSC